MEVRWWTFPRLGREEGDGVRVNTKIKLLVFWFSYSGCEWYKVRDKIGDHYIINCYVCTREGELQKVNLLFLTVFHFLSLSDIWKLRLCQ